MIDVVTEPLAKRAEVVRGVTFSKRDAVGEPLEGYMPVLRAGNIQSSLLLDDNLVFVPKNKISERQIIRSGDIVMCTSSGSADIVGKTAYAHENWDGSFGAFCAVVRPKVADCDPRYLYHYLQSPAFRHWTQNSSGANIKNIRKTELDALEIPFPRLSEQRRIAAILDKADAIRRKRERALALADDLLKSTFLEMFGDPVTNPKSWDRVPIGEACERVTVGIVIKPASHYVPSGIPALRSLNVREGYIDLDKLVFFSSEANETTLKKSRLWSGDVVVVRSGQPGKAAIVPDHLNGINAIDILITTPDQKKITSQYLCDFLNSAGGRQLVLSEERGQIQKHLNVKSLKEALIPLPAMKVLSAYSDLTGAIRTATSNLEAAYDDSFGLFASLSQRAFRGEL